MAQIPYGNEAYRKRNPHLFPVSDAVQLVEKPAPSSPKRIRQNSKPLMNKLETNYYAHLQLYHAATSIHIQAVTFKLANGVRYSPDFFIVNPPMAFEVKGEWFTDDSNVKLKTAASVYPEISWRLVWKVDGCWNEQIILP